MHSKCAFQCFRSIKSHILPKTINRSWYTNRNSFSKFISTSCWIIKDADDRVHTVNTIRKSIDNKKMLYKMTRLLSLSFLLKSEVAVVVLLCCLLSTVQFFRIIKTSILSTPVHSGVHYIQFSRSFQQQQQRIRFAYQTEFMCRLFRSNSFLSLCVLL